jgi:hypothetical protein
MNILSMEREIGKELVTYYESMKSLESDPEAEGKKAVRLIMAMNDMGAILLKHMGTHNKESIAKEHFRKQRDESIIEATRLMDALKKLLSAQEYWSEEAEEAEELIKSIEDDSRV